MVGEVDIVVFTHTGHTSCGCVPEIDGFKCVTCSPRTYDAESGGVAVYAKKGLHVSVIRDLPIFGMSWFRVHAKGRGKDIYGCACYLPHESSTYYDKEDGRIDARAHFDCLSEGISKYRVLGEVVIMGDLNARTGVVDDRWDANDVQTWEDMEGAGVPIPTGLVDMHAVTAMISNRVSSDVVANKHGQMLLDVCREQGIVVLNGRLPGDEQGCYTYYFHGVGGGPRSLIDYFVSTPGLTFQASGAVRGGSGLRVHSLDSMPLRPGGGKYDHLPVTLTFTIDTSVVPVVAGRVKSGGRAEVSFKWNVDHRDKYVDILLGDPEVTVSLGAMYTANQIDDIDGSFSGAIEVALARLHDKVGKVVVHPREEARVCSRPRNSWYDDKCRAAKVEYVRAERQHGVASEVAKLAFQEYRRVIRGAKRAWVHDKDQAVMQDLRKNPKRFWSVYGRSENRGGQLGLDEWTGYFGKLFQANSSGVDGVSGSDEVYDRLFPEPDGHKIECGAVLNRDFSVVEVITALQKAANGKSPGVDGVPMEFLKHAVLEVYMEGKCVKHNILAGHITHLFNSVLRKGYPRSWTTGVVVPVPKSKGSLDNMDDYRGITVGRALAKLYSMVMLQRLDAWAEGNGMRARGQAGFRNGRGTPDNAFVLNHVIEKYRSHKKPVYAAFIDFRKAYDSVDRRLLWECMRSIGVHGCFLDSLIAMYEEVRIRVRVGGKLGDSFQSDVGVKQGDPLSPLLFGLFIDRLEGLIHDMLPDVGVHMKDVFLKVLLYADDLVLLAETPGDLQRMLDLLLSFCKHNNMVVNIKKSEGVVFNRQFCSYARRGRGIKVKYNGTELVLKPMFVYLGMLYEEEGGIRKSANRSLSKGRSAAYAMTRRCHELDIHNVFIKCHLFDSLVKPILMYGCEVWGPSVMAGGKCLVDSGFTKELELLHKGFLRQCLGVRKSVPDVVLMSEMRRKPIALSLLKQLLCFWNKIQCRADDDLVKLAMQESYELAKGGVRDCWVGHLAKCVGKFGVDLFGRSDFILDVNEVLDVAQAQWQARMLGNLQPEDGVRGMVRSLSDDVHVGFKTITYFRWFADVESDIKTTFWYALNRPEQISTVARFRMGCHWLNIENDRIAKPYTPRSRRLCRCCEMGVREDELHVLECPLYQDLRCAHGVLSYKGVCGSEDTVMKEHMNSSDIGGAFWNRMASFLIRCKFKRELFS